MKTISVESLSIISFSNIPVVTTELLASLYGTEPDYIRKNFNRNSGRFVIGKHYFLLENEELREFKHSMSLRPSVKIARNVRSLILWTERGAARHAKMLQKPIGRGKCSKNWKSLLFQSKNPRTTSASRINAIYQLPSLVVLR
ncbi:anti-repressor [Escherichia phage phi191]|uniref:Anti-repressor protein n=1 Tax=Escherichia phage phi191 TaxID=1458706 RepID=A0A096XEP2_9CAUD|nr:anti-repressor [Escherichia phage phi191]AHJ10623.1 anti-repressor protein [Escherichia phage phi191]